MGLKEFYKLSWRRALITVVLFAIISLYLVLFGNLFVVDGAPMTSAIIIIYIFFWPTLILNVIFGAIFERSTALTGIFLSILAIIINGFYFYTLGCLIDPIIKKAKSK